VEPLEASALVMIEMAAGMIADQLPPTREVMDIVAKRYNEKFLRHWNKIIEFLKLHYVLTARDDSAYWQDCRATTSIPDELREKLSLWRYRSPWHQDEEAVGDLFPSLWRYRSPWHQDEEAVGDLFPTASYQYILYGMGFTTAPWHTRSHQQDQQQRQASELFHKNAARAIQLQRALPSNRELLNKVREFGFQKL
jgi:hypothetical protein